MFAFGANAAHLQASTRGVFDAVSSGLSASDKGKNLCLSSTLGLSGFVDSTGQLAFSRQYTIILSEKAASSPKAFGQYCYPASFPFSNAERLWFCAILKV